MIGYGEVLRLQFDIDHTTTKMEFSYIVTSGGVAGAEQKFVYPGANIVLLGSPAIAGGASFVFTSPKLTTPGAIIVKALTDYGISPKEYRDVIQDPKVPLLQGDV